MPREESLCACTFRTSLPCGLLLPQLGVSCCSCSGGFSPQLVTRGADLPAARGAVTRFTSAACLFSHPLPGGGPCAMDCSVLFCFPSVRIYIFLYMHMWKRGYRYRPGFPSFCLPSHSQINTSRHAALSPEISEAVWLHSLPPSVYSGPRFVLLKNSDMEKCINVSCPYQPRDLFWGGT